MSEQGSAKNGALSRRDFLKLLATVGISALILGLIVLANQTNSSSKDYPTVGKRYSVQELLSNPDLIRVRSIEDKFVHLFSDRIGPDFSCATLGLSRVSKDNLEQSQTFTSARYFDITDDDLNKVPHLKELIAATHQIPIPYNDDVHIPFYGPEFVEYEFFLMDKMIEKYGGTQKDYFMKLDEDYKERLTDFKQQGFSNEFLAPQIVYGGNSYDIGGTVFWTSEENNLSMSVSLKDSLDEDQKYVTLNDDDMENIPKIKNGINDIGTKLEYVAAFKGVTEPELDYYGKWFDEQSNLLSDGKQWSAEGFVYDGEYYQMNNSIC